MAGEGEKRKAICKEFRIEKTFEVVQSSTSKTDKCLGAFKQHLFVQHLFLLVVFALDVRVLNGFFHIHSSAKKSRMKHSMNVECVAQ